MFHLIFDIVHAEASLSYTRREASFTENARWSLVVERTSVHLKATVNLKLHPDAALRNACQ